MSIPPKEPKIYHITHVDNLSKIIAEQAILSDAQMIARGNGNANVGMSAIKQRRLRLPISCLPNLCVGDCVPFYFCPRSVMLCVIYYQNNPSLKYVGGQDPIVHLEANLFEVVEYAGLTGKRWAFSLSNAGSNYAEFRDKLEELVEINWEAVAAQNFRASDIKEGKQAEFLFNGSFPWSLVKRIGVKSNTVKIQVQTVLDKSVHKPQLDLMRDWYY